ncbi:MAG TPA: UDP-galactopyranose mutase [Sphingobium sp.]
MTLLCFSHLRWAFVFQRPQHLMSIFAAERPVLYWEEPIDSQDGSTSLALMQVAPNITVATPLLPAGMRAEVATDTLKNLLDAYLAGQNEPLIRWYYTPMMLKFSRHLAADCTIYDCMDELANFRFAPPELVALEQELFAAADLVFTGGYSLYEAKRTSHPAVYPFPSSVDIAHFAQARQIMVEPADQATLPGPRFGFYGVIDERMDLDLLASLADARPEWTFVLIGPVVKIDPAHLPRRNNIAYLGAKAYEALPAYASGWDVALMPFAINESTRFISPTKTPEYLAAGLPVVSTPIIDVARHYGSLDAVEIAGNVDLFLSACERSLIKSRPPGLTWRTEADAALAGQSWHNVAEQMSELISEATASRQTDEALSRPHYDYLVVGAGFAGSVMAERLAADAGKRVLVIDRRPHIAGNAYDEADAAGILIHRYGPHIFHTNSQPVVDYLSRFTAWRPYEHRVLADIEGVHVPMPINRTTLNTLYGLDLDSDAEAAAFLEARAEPVEPIVTSADVVVSKVGTELYETFFRGYTRKQWGMDPSELDKSVTARVPTRTNTDDRYFTDSFQAMPAAGYTRMFKAMLDHANITVELGVDFTDIQKRVSFDRLVFTGPIDEYFDHVYGRLPYRSLAFRHETIDSEWYQPVAVVNYPDEKVPHTRITEYKHLTGQTSPKTSISYEIPKAEGDPYYPIPRPENQQLFKRYETLALGTPDVLFVGRLATYRYYNMDQVVAQALSVYRRHVANADNGARLESDPQAIAAE